MFWNEFCNKNKKIIIMKKLSLLFTLCAFVLLISCTGPAGPPGYSELGKVFEATANTLPNSE